MKQYIVKWSVVKQEQKPCEDTCGNTVKFRTVADFWCWEFPPQMALMTSCDLINNDLVLKLYIFILYLNLCNIFCWENFVYGNDFYIERIYCQISLYIYCLVFLVFLRIYWLFSPLSLIQTIIWCSQRQNLSVSNKHGINMEHITLGKLKTKQKTFRWT